MPDSFETPKTVNCLINETIIQIVRKRPTKNTHPVHRRCIRNRKRIDVRIESDRFLRRWFFSWAQGAHFLRVGSSRGHYLSTSHKKFKYGTLALSTVGTAHYFQLIISATSRQMAHCGNETCSERFRARLLIWFPELFSHRGNYIFYIYHLQLRQYKDIKHYARWSIKVNKDSVPYLQQ